MTETVPFELIDAHHHLWNLEAVDYPWLRARGVHRFFGDPTPIQQNFGVDELRRSADGIRILASVHVQVGCAPGSEVDETAFLERTARRDALPTAIVAAADLTRPDLGEMLAQHRHASARLRGIRQIVGREPADDRRTGCGRVIDDPRFGDGLCRLADEDLSFDLQLTVPQMLPVRQLLDSVPHLRVALCHVGSPWDRSAAGLAEWRAGLSALAELPRVYCKLSGLSMFEPAWTEPDFMAILDVAIACFGVERCLFGSNFPVDGLHRTYPEIVSATRTAVGRHGGDAEERIFRSNARTFYRL